MFSFIKSFFTKKVTKPAHSELSNPRTKRIITIDNRKDLKNVLKELSRYQTPVCSHDFLYDTGIWSADKRLSDLKKLGFATCEIRVEGNARRGYWMISQKGTELLDNI